MATWRLAHSLTTLRNEVNAKWPGRSRASDGTIGDTAHSARTSDHNPDPAGVVRAMDITSKGIDAAWYAEHLRTLGASGHPPLQNHGYIIFNRRAAYATKGWHWQPYTGSNTHEKHVHVSVGRDPAQYDSKASWRIAGGSVVHPSNLELTVGQYEDIMKAINDCRQGVLLTKAQVDHLQRAVTGITGAEQDQSIYWNTRYLRAELISEEKLPKLRAILDRYGDPMKTD